MELKKIEKRLQKELSAHRYTHTMGVMYTAAALAMAHGGSMEKAMYAGLLHDCAKSVPNEEQLSLCQEYGIPVSSAEEKAPYLLHPKLGSYYAKKIYKVTDEEILHAITTHTTGEPYMNLLDKIIFIADYMEPHRDRAPNLAEVRRLAFVDLDLCMLHILEETLAYLKRSGGIIDPTTAETYEYFRQKGS